MMLTAEGNLKIQSSSKLTFGLATTADTWVAIPLLPGLKVAKIFDAGVDNIFFVLSEDGKVYIIAEPVIVGGPCMELFYSHECLPVTSVAASPTIYQAVGGFIFFMLQDGTVLRLLKDVKRDKDSVLLTSHPYPLVPNIIKVFFINKINET